MYPYINFLNITIPSYGLCVCAAVFLCSALIFSNAHKANINFNDLIIVIAISIGGGMLGGVFLYILVTYDFLTLFSQIAAGNLSFIKNPGLVFYGGLLAGISSGIVTAKVLRIEIKDVEMCLTPYIPLGHAIGRIGCILAGCCYGFPYNGPLAISTIFDPEHGTYFPIQAVEALFNLITSGALLIYVRKERYEYSVISLYLIMYSFFRFILEFFRGDFLRGNFLCFSTSQWISLIVFLFSIIILRKIFANEKNI